MEVRDPLEAGDSGPGGRTAGCCGFVIRCTLFPWKTFNAFAAG